MLEVILVFFFLFAENAISGRRKLGTNLIWLSQIANLDTRENKKDNSPFWHFSNEDSLQKETEASLTQIVFVLSLSIPKDEKRFCSWWKTKPFNWA